MGHSWGKQINSFVWKLSWLQQWLLLKSNMKNTQISDLQPLDHIVGFTN